MKEGRGRFFYAVSAMNGHKMNNYFNILQPASLKWNERFAEWIKKKYFRKNGRIVDLGCGRGELAEIFKRKGYSVEAYDYPEIDLEKKLKLKSDFYDYIVCKFVFEHIKNITGLMSEIHRILKKGGICIVLTDNTVADLEGFLEDPTHVTPFSLKRLKNLALMSNLRIIQLRKWRNIPYIWRYTSRAFDYSFLNSKQIIGIFQK